MPSMAADSSYWRYTTISEENIYNLNLYVSRFNKYPGTHNSTFRMY